MIETSDEHPEPTSFLGHLMNEAPAQHLILLKNPSPFDTRPLYSTLLSLFLSDLETFAPHDYLKALRVDRATFFAHDSGQSLSKLCNPTVKHTC